MKAASVRLNVLVIDDDAIDRMSVRRHLKSTQENLQVVEAENCQIALELIREQVFDCIFVDYNLPDGNGIDLVQQLRQMGLRVPLIALTGQGDEQIAVDLMKAGASDYISKAKIKPDLLYRVVQQCLRIYQAEQEAERAKLLREELLAQREEFISRMTHDMQTPLVGANRMLELIQDDAFGDIPASVKAKIGIITRSNHDLLKMVRDLVEVYTYDAGCKELNRLPIDIRSIVEEVFQQLGPLAQDKQLDLKLVVSDPGLNHEILVDRLEMKRVLINLIGNSLKFTELGGITLTLEGSSPANPCLKMTLQDTGIGISEEDQTQIFERFRRGRHKRSNSGLGLYLSRQIIEGHQGKIQVESIVNQGTTFTISLPALPH
ncbi:MAG: hybrid sensor histidine kinase/response regulator [Alkalinema sp. RU_4_3]|nr:hybrid sensor histidine kinase/response regulator [Alkalinema sp. RU_4_3]